MLVDILQELLNVWVTTAVQVGVADIDHYVFEVVFFLLPLQVLLEFWQTKGLEEYLNT